ncbi:MAG TPA: IS21 family transposase [Acidimicrobiales bacterium]|jgi:transposase|nr:IS21 family transposase [Acidimicrobiales bacterium]
MDIVTAYEQVGTYRGAAALCGTTHKTVRRVIEANRAGLAPDRPRRPAKGHNTDCVRDLIAEKVKTTDGRISAKRLLPIARAAGYSGSARNLRRAVATAKADWRRRRRVYRPWLPTPGEHLVIDWTTEGGWQVFCAVVAWSRYRFVRVARDQTAVTTMRMLTECFEDIGGVPKVVLADRMGCLKGGVVANVMVPTSDYIRFATHFGFRPDFCEAADPESKGMVEALCGYVQTDLVVPAAPWADEAEANTAARAWCAEVNEAVHSTIAARPTDKLAEEALLFRPLPNLRPPLRAGERRRVDKLSTVRFGSARYSVPKELVGKDVWIMAGEGEVRIECADQLVAAHRLVGPGETSIADEHYGGPRRGPARAVRARSGPERAFLALGPTAEAFLRAAAAAGTSRLGSEIVQITALEAAWGREALVSGLARAVQFRRFRAADVRSILEAGSGVPTVVGEGTELGLDLPPVPTRDLADYSLAALA